MGRADSSFPSEDDDGDDDDYDDGDDDDDDDDTADQWPWDASKRAVFQFHSLFVFVFWSFTSTQSPCTLLESLALILFGLSMS